MGLDVLTDARLVPSTAIRPRRVTALAIRGLVSIRIARFLEVDPPRVLDLAETACICHRRQAPLTWFRHTSGGEATCRRTNDRVSRWPGRVGGQPPIDICR